MLPIKVIHDNRLTYLVSLETSYSELGYGTRLRLFSRTLEVYAKGIDIPFIEEDKATVEKWID